MGMGQKFNPHKIRVTPIEFDVKSWCMEENNLVDSALELHNQLNNSNWDLNEIRRIFSKTDVSDFFVRDNPNNCDSSSITQGAVLKKKMK